MMGKYGPGLTMGKICSLEKEMIRNALHGYEKNEDGAKHPVTHEETEKMILAAYDEAYFQLNRAMASGRALDGIIHEIIKENGLKLTEADLLKMYVSKIAEEEGRYAGDYKFEQ